MSTRGLPTALALAMLAAPGAALADAGTEWQSGIAGSGGYTDNAGAHADDDPLKRESPFLSLQPSLSLFYATPRTTHKFTYGLSLNIFTDADEFNAYSNTLSWGVAHTPSRRTEILVETALGYQQSNTLTIDTGAGSGPDIAAGVAGDIKFLSLNAGQGLAHEIDAQWRVIQGAGFTYVMPIDDDTSIGDALSMVLGGGGERRYRRDTLGGDLQLGYSHIENGDAVPDQDTVTTRATVRWGHDLTDNWSTEIGVGWLLAWEPEIDTANAPVGNIALSFQNEHGSAGIGASRGAVLNPFIGEVLLTDEASLRAGLPLFEQKIQLGAQVGVSHSESLISDPMSAVLPTDVDVLFGDVSVAWKVADNLDVGARYQVTYQDSANWPNPERLGTPDLDRHVFLVTVSGRYPNETRTRLPYRRPLRMQKVLQEEDDKKAPGGRPQ